MVLVFAENHKGTFKKTTHEAVTYGKKTAELLGMECVALTLGEVQDAGSLGVFGASNVYNDNNGAYAAFDSSVYASAIGNAIEQLGAKVLIMPHSSTGKSILGRLAARFNAASVPGVNALPTNDGSFKVTKTVFSGKAFATMEMKGDMKMISVMGNSIAVEESGVAVDVESMDLAPVASKVTVKETKTIEGTVPLPEAELVVSGGRGFKGPENFGIMEELAKALGATTACSRPVADSDWRPHHEHVGQTGIAIRPNLYIAIGISGAIQHLAGVNNSKTIVVINKDPEAPFFKAADYGVVGDLFEVVPKLTAAVKAMKG